MWTPDIETSEKVDIAVGATLATTVMAAGEAWRFKPTVACWIKQGDNTVTATAASGSMYVSAGEEVFLEPGFEHGVRLSVIRASGDGTSTLTRMRYRPD